MTEEVERNVVSERKPCIMDGNWDDDWMETIGLCPGHVILYVPGPYTGLLQCAAPVWDMPSSTNIDTRRPQTTTKHDIISQARLPHPYKLVRRRINVLNVLVHGHKGLTPTDLHNAVTSHAWYYDYVDSSTASSGCHYTDQNLTWFGFGFQLQNFVWGVHGLWDRLMPDTMKLTIIPQAWNKLSLFKGWQLFRNENQTWYTRNFRPCYCSALFKRVARINYNNKSGCMKKLRITFSFHPK